MLTIPLAEFSPVRVLFGGGCVTEIGTHCGAHPLLVTTRGAVTRGTVARVQRYLPRALVFDGARVNPDIADVEAAAGELRCALVGRSPVSSVIALGGGSVIDLAKALSFALDNPDVLGTIVRSGEEIAPNLPVIAVPTTAGSGSEVTPFATLWDSQRHKKYSLERVLPHVAIVDPELTYLLPWAHTLGPGLDALSQAFEALWSKRASQETDRLATLAIVSIPSALSSLQTSLHDPDARATLMYAGLLSGLAIARTRTGLAHSISYPLTAHYGLAHGLACSMTLPRLWGWLADEHPAWADRTSRGLGVSTAQLVGDNLTSLLSGLGTPRECLKCLGSFATVYRHETEMLTPGRSDNMRSPATHVIVHRILVETERDLFEPLVT